MSETGNCFYSFISSNYENIKRNLKKGLSSFVFDEDIYHDTLIKCMELDIDLTSKEMYNYIFIAFKTNLLREPQYHRNKVVEGLDDTLVDKYYYSQDFVSKMDYSLLLKQLVDKFPKDDMEYFKEWIHGHPIREIEEMHHLTNLTYRIKLIRQYISDKHLLVDYQL